MKITFITPYLSINGGNRVITIYAQKLQKLGHDVLIVCQPQRKITLKQKIKSIIKRDLSFLDQNKTFSFYDSLNVPYKILESNRPVIDSDVPDADVVIATWWETAEWVANLSPSKGAKAYFMQDYGAPGQEIEKLIPTWQLPLHIITISGWLVELVKKYTSEEKYIDIATNSVDFNIFNADLREKNNPPIVGLMYRSMPTKGFPIAINAIQIAQQNLPSIKIIMFGSKKIEKTISLPKNTLFYLKPNDLQVVELYRRCDIFLFSSLIEGFGLPILEAMACRTPVIGTPAGAAPELISQGGGILVKPEDPEDMAKAIIRIAQMSNDEWKLMSDKAYETATGYTWDDAAKLFEQALYRAIERTKKGEL